MKQCGQKQLTHCCSGTLDQRQAGPKTWGALRHVCATLRAATQPADSPSPPGRLRPRAAPDRSWAAPTGLHKCKLCPPAAPHNPTARTGRLPICSAVSARASESLSASTTRHTPPLPPACYPFTLLRLPSQNAPHHQGKGGAICWPRPVPVGPTCSCTRTSAATTACTLSLPPALAPT